MHELEQNTGSCQALWLRYFFNPSSLPYAAILSGAAVLVLPATLCFGLALLLMICAAIIDWQTYRLPDCLTLPTFVLALYGAPEAADIRLLGAIGASGLILLVGTVFRKVRGYPGLGFGDVKLAAGCGSIVGLGGVGGLLLLSSMLALISLMLIGFVRGPRPFKLTAGTSSIAFGPFLVLATFLITFAQQEGVLA
ncbi:prepilin peptidase [Labrys sp. KB_33_2]|uniref:prepilin peptidase n=1 Tax=Labrys sp. KB_33_2 TaxID=3237479 RepID=UPI003F92C6AD